MLNVLHLQELDVSKICAELKMKRDGSPQFFMRIPIVVDCSELDLDVDKTTGAIFSALRKGLQDLGFVTIGARNVANELKETLLESGWTLMPENAKNNAVAKNAEQVQVTEEQTQKENLIATEPPKNTAAKGQSKPAPKISSLTINRPVRSGQQIYAAGGDLTVLAATSAGSEIMADGSIHVYGALRGRVLAGVSGNQSARIFCSSLQAELIVIAGRYQLLDESNTSLIGKPAMISLEGEKLIIEPLS